MERKEKKLKLRPCFICPNRTEKGLFSVPKSSTVREKWLSAINKESVKPSDKICYQHFQPTCFWPNSGVGGSSYRLWDDAIPTLNLPTSEEPVHNHISDHNYSTDVTDPVKVINTAKITAQNFSKARQQLEEELSESKKIINSLKLEIYMLKAKMDSKEHKEAICYEVLEGKLTKGQLDILVKVSTLWGFQIRHS